MTKSIATVVFVCLLGGCTAVSIPAVVPQESAATQSDAVAPYLRTVKALQYEELAATYTLEGIDRVLQGQLVSLPDADRRAAATLVSVGALNVGDFGDAERVRLKLNQFVSMMGSPHPARLGRVGDAALLERLSQPLVWDNLLAARSMLADLGKGLSDGVITGYDLREQGVFDALPSAHTFVYSHSSLAHVRQLVVLLHREGVQAWVYLTPKVSAFLYREDWGGDGENLATLPSGIKVVQGREMAVAFQFQTPADRQRFHEVVEAYAKRDTEEESGLIAESWWQPFYYTDAALAGFEPIALLVLSDGEFEATLTVVEERAAIVREAMRGSQWQLREERVWVNPAFYRFLNGDYK